MHQQAMRIKVHAPRTNVLAKDFEQAIMRRENDVRNFEEACAPEIISEPNRRMFLKHLYPYRLRDHLTAQGSSGFPSWVAWRFPIGSRRARARRMLFQGRGPGGALARQRGPGAFLGARRGEGL